jgi:ribosomal-protein-alanine N-acetyltransferase
MRTNPWLCSRPAPGLQPEEDASRITADACAPALPPALALPPPPTDWREGLPVLHLPGVTLREPLLSDADSLWALLATDAVARFMTKPPDSTGGFAQFIAWAQSARLAGRSACFVIVPDGRSDAVGLIQVRQLEPGFGMAEWGFALGQPYWGTGLFLKSARAVVDFAFREIGIHRLEARAAVENGRGNGVLRRLGAVPEGVLRQSLISDNRRANQLLWALLADDWLPAHPSPPYRREGPLASAPQVMSGEKSARGPGTALWRGGLPVLRGSQVTLRELAVHDAPSLRRLLTTPEVVRFILPPPDTIEGFEQFIRWTHQRRAAGTHTSFGVVPDGQQAVVGIFQMQQLDATFRTAEWGFALGSPYWGTGAFSDAAELVLRFAFETVGVKRLEARTVGANGRGNGALRKVGAVLEAHLRRSFLLGGAGYTDDFLWAILEDEWRQSRHPM